MMELEELKRVWNTKRENIYYSRAELETIFEVRTKRNLKLLNRNMLIDAVLMLVTTITFILITFIIGLKNRFWISGELLFIATVLIIHYRIKYLSINNYDFEKQGIKKILMSAVKRLKWYLKLYKFILPTLSATLYIVYLVQVHYYQFGNYSIENTNQWKWILVLPVILITYLLVAVLSKIIYGKGLVRLQRSLEQLN